MSATILIAEDDVVQRRILSTMLSKKLGYRVIESEHGHEALSKLRSSEIDEISAVLLDIQMPVMDGFETLRAICRERPDLPILMVTATDDAASR
jgi:CheY-like chemotaxis protein